MGENGFDREVWKYLQTDVVSTGLKNLHIITDAHIHFVPASVLKAKALV